MKLPFDECWLVNLVERPDRKQYMLNQFKQLGILDQVKIHQAVKGPTWLYDIFKNAINELNNVESGLYKGQIDTPHAIGCWREQYTLIKSAYLRGLNSIMIIEDDCGFLKNGDIIQEYLDNLPDDWGVLRINCLRGPKTQKFVEYYEKDYNYWLPQRTVLWGTGCYALSRNGMKYVLDWYEQYFDSIDAPITSLDNIVIKNSRFSNYKSVLISKYNCKVYIPKIPLGLCHGDAAEQSDLHNNMTVREEKNLRNVFFLYEQIPNINIEDYF